MNKKLLFQLLVVMRTRREAGEEHPETPTTALEDATTGPSRPSSTTEDQAQEEGE